MPVTTMAMVRHAPPRSLSLCTALTDSNNSNCCCLETHVAAIHIRPGPVTLLHPHQLLQNAQKGALTSSSQYIRREMQNIVPEPLKRRLGGKEGAACGTELDQRHDPKHGLPRRWDGGPIAAGGIERPACSSSRPTTCCYAWLAMGRNATGAIGQPQPERKSQSGVAQNDEEA